MLATILIFIAIAIWGGMNYWELKKTKYVVGLLQSQVRNMSENIGEWAGKFNMLQSWSITKLNEYNDILQKQNELCDRMNHQIEELNKKIFELNIQKMNLETDLESITTEYSTSIQSLVGIADWVLEQFNGAPNARCEDLDKVCLLVDYIHEVDRVTMGLDGHMNRAVEEATL